MIITKTTTIAIIIIIDNLWALQFHNSPGCGRRSPDWPEQRDGDDGDDGESMPNDRPDHELGRNGGQGEKGV